MRREHVICLCLFLVTIGLYWQVTGFDFVNYDDGDYVTENRHVQQGLTADGVRWAFTTGHASNWHPLTWLSHMLDCELFGVNPGRHHLTSVVIHATNAVLLFLLFYRMTGALGSCAVLAAVFAWHPLRVESVAWVAERKDVLSTLFGLLAMLAYAGYAKSRRWPLYAGSLALFALSLMSKAMLVTLPFLLLLLDVWPLDRLGWFDKKVQARPVPWKTLVLEKVPFLLLTVLSSIATVWAQGRGGAVVTLKQLTFGERLANALASYPGYLKKMVWPFDLAVLYPYPEQAPTGMALVGVVLVVGGVVAAFRWRRTAPWFSLGWLWFAGTLVPVIGLVQVGSQAMADRYTYFPGIGIALVVAWGLKEWRERVPVGRLAVGAAGLFGLVCVFVTFLQVGVWQNGVTLFGNAVTVTRNNHIAHNNFGTALLLAGQTQEAVEQFRAALALRAGYAEAHLNLGVALSETGRFDEAHQEFETAVTLNPRLADAHYYLGISLASRGQPDAAAAALLKAAELAPDAVATRMNVAVVLLKQRQFAAAADQLAEVLKRAPGDAGAWDALGMARYEQGNAEEAAAAWEKAVALNPGSPSALQGLAWLLATHPAFSSGSPARATQLAEHSVRLQVGDPMALDVLAAAYANEGRFQEAVTAARQAAELAAQAGRNSLHQAILERIQRYEARQPWRARNRSTEKESSKPGASRSGGGQRSLARMRPVAVTAVRASNS